MIATATHDTKRGEEARARLNALSEMPDVWRDALERFERIAAPHVASHDSEEAPDANDRYMLFQALLGAWPVELLEEEAPREAADAFRQRIEEYLLKALREAKRHTSWVHGNEAYESAATGLLTALLDPGGAFLTEFRPLARRLAGLGMLNGLARTALKATLPGVPDIYQGTEFWDLSLVDPDNRRPVDYDARMRALERSEPLPQLLRSWRDGRVKQGLLARLLADRAATPSLYADGAYQPLQAKGDKARNVLAFVRSCGTESLAVVAPRLVASIAAGEAMPLGGVWGDTVLPLAPGRWRNILTDAIVEPGERGCDLGELFADFPIAILRNGA